MTAAIVPAKSPTRSPDKSPGKSESPIDEDDASSVFSESCTSYTGSTFDATNSTQTTPRGSGRKRTKKKKHRDEAKREAAAPTEAEVVRCLRDVGKQASGYGQAFLTFEMHKHQGVRNTDFLSKWVHLQKLYLADNVITETKSLGNLQHLVHVDLSYNKLEEVLEVEAPPIYLRHADYSFNNVRALRDLSAFCFLRELQLDNNQLTALTGMQSLKALRVLSLKNNQLEHIGGLQHLRLHTLCISNNQVRTLEPLASLLELQVLIADHNCLEHMKGLGSLAMLGTLDVSCNKIHTLEELKNVMHLHMLRSLNLQQNHMETVTSSRMHTLHVLPQLTVLNDLDVRQQDKTYASNLQGTDYVPTRRVRNRLFPNGELDDGGNADPPLCVSLPPSLGRELCNPGTSLQDADRHACAPEANQAALQADTETEFVQYFMERFPRNPKPELLAMLRSIFVWTVNNGRPFEGERSLGLLNETAPVLSAELAEVEQLMIPTDGAAESGLWAERITKLFTTLVRAAGLEAETITGYQAPASWMPPEWMPLIVPNYTWTAVNLRDATDIQAKDAWRLIDIAQAVQDRNLDLFFVPPEEFIKTYLPLAVRWQLLGDAPVLSEPFWMAATDAASKGRAQRIKQAAAEKEYQEVTTRQTMAQNIAAHACQLSVLEERLPTDIANLAIAKAISEDRTLERASGAVRTAP